MNIIDKGKITVTATIVHKDKNGKIKRLFNRNRFGEYLGKIGIDVKIPFVTGFYADSLKLNLTK